MWLVISFAKHFLKMLQMISWDRYNVIVNGFKGTPLTFSKAIIMIMFSWIFALGWSISPLFGWGYYGILDYNFYFKLM